MLDILCFLYLASEAWEEQATRQGMKVKGGHTSAKSGSSRTALLRLRGRCALAHERSRVGGTPGDSQDASLSVSCGHSFHRFEASSRGDVLAGCFGLTLAGRAALPLGEADQPFCYQPARRSI